MELVKEIIKKNISHKFNYDLCKWQFWLDIKTNKYYVSYFEYFTLTGWKLIINHKPVSSDFLFLFDLHNIFFD